MSLKVDYKITGEYDAFTVHMEEEPFMSYSKWNGWTEDKKYWAWKDLFYKLMVKYGIRYHNDSIGSYTFLYPKGDLEVRQAIIDTLNQDLTWLKEKDY